MPRPAAASVMQHAAGAPFLQGSSRSLLLCQGTTNQPQGLHVLHAGSADFAKGPAPPVLPAPSARGWPVGCALAAGLSLGHPLLPPAMARNTLFMPPHQQHHLCISLPPACHIQYPGGPSRKALAICTHSFPHTSQPHSPPPSLQAITPLLSATPRAPLQPAAFHRCYPQAACCHLQPTKCSPLTNL